MSEMPPQSADKKCVISNLRCKSTAAHCTANVVVIAEQVVILTNEPSGVIVEKSTERRQGG